MLMARDVPTLRENGHGHVYQETTEYFNGAIGSSDLERLLESVTNAASLLEPGRACVIYGYGSSTRSLYRQLDELDGIVVLWHANFGPWWMKPLLSVAASRGGLLQVTNREAAAVAFLPMAHLAMVELYSFRAELLPSIVKYVRKNTWRSFIGTLLGEEDPSYFCLGVDGDVPDNDLDYFGWVSFGGECPVDLQQVAPSTSKGGK